MIPKDLLYSETHEWALIDGNEAMVGITDFAQQQLGDLTYVELPEPGDVVEAGQEMGSVESVKAANELYSPVSGEVIAVNSDLDTAPERINEDPYGEGWMIKVRLSGEAPEDLLTADDYERLLASEGH